MIYVTATKTDDACEDDILRRFPSSREYVSEILSRANNESKRQSLSGLSALLFLLDYVGEKTEALVLKRQKGGKPYFENSDWQFGISHSGDIAVCGLSKNAVGIDVEQLKPRKNVLAFAKRFFSEGEYVIMQKSANPEFEFYNIWTKKEARLKSIGKGVDTDLTKIDTTKQEFTTLRAYDCVINVCGASVKFIGGK